MLTLIERELHIRELLREGEARTGVPWLCVSGRGGLDEPIFVMPSNGREKPEPAADDE